VRLLSVHPADIGHRCLIHAAPSLCASLAFCPSLSSSLHLRLCIKNDVRAMEEMMMMTGPEPRHSQVRSGLAGLKAATIPPLFFARIRLGRIFRH